MKSVKVTTQHFDIKHVDKDVLYQKFEEAILAKNMANSHIATEMMIIKKKLNLEDNNPLWLFLQEKLGYPLHTICINNEPLISAEEIDGEIILSGEIVAISDIIPGSIKTRISIKYDDIFDNTADCISNASIKMLKENIATLVNLLDHWSGGFVFTPEGGWMGLDKKSIKEIQELLASPSVKIVKNEEDK